jgi:hypothetical protein
MADKLNDLTKNLDAGEKTSALKGIYKIVTKLIRYAKGGLSPEEKRDLGADLTELGTQLLTDAIDPA